MFEPGIYEVYRIWAAEVDFANALQALQRTFEFGSFEVAWVWDSRDDDVFLINKPFTVFSWPINSP